MDGTEDRLLIVGGWASKKKDKDVWTELILPTKPSYGLSMVLYCDCLFGHWRFGGQGQKRST